LGTSSLIHENCKPAPPPPPFPYTCRSGLPILLVRLKLSFLTLPRSRALFIHYRVAFFYSQSLSLVGSPPFLSFFGMDLSATQCASLGDLRLRTRHFLKTDSIGLGFSIDHRPFSSVAWVLGPWVRILDLPLSKEEILKYHAHSILHEVTFGSLTYLPPPEFLFFIHLSCGIEPSPLPLIRFALAGPKIYFG